MVDLENRPDSRNNSAGLAETATESHLMKSVLTIIVLLATVSVSLAEEHWPSFRGPNADGVAADHAGLPTTWTKSDNVKWVADVAGWGWSCPVVWGDRVFVTAVVSDDKNLTPSKGLYLGQGVRTPGKGAHHWLVYCFDLKTGAELWKQEAHSGRPKVPRHPKSTYASETATTDGKRLYVLFGDLGLYCYDLDGKPLWSQPIAPKKTARGYGAAASPVVHDGQVIVVYDNLEGSWIAAFDAKTGNERWRTAREETHSWATPFIWRNEIRTEIVVPGRKRNRSYSLTGELLWEFDGKMSSLVIPSPFAAHGMCYIASGYIGDAHRPTYAVRPGASGDITPDGGFKNGKDFEGGKFIAWYDGKSSSYNPSQIVYGDYLYTLYDRGFLTCHDARTGKQVYGKKRFSPAGSFTASPWAYSGHLFFLSEDGLTYVVKAGPDFEIVGRNQLDELSISSPAIAGGNLLIRTASKLYCLTNGAKRKPAAAGREKGSIEEKTKVHRLSNSSRSAFDAFVYVNRLPDKPEAGEDASDLVGRIFGRLANQEGRVLLKLPPGMDRNGYLGFKTFLRATGAEGVGNCAACHALAELTDSKTHVVRKSGAPKPTPSLRNLGKRRLDLRKVLLEKIVASQQKRNGAGDDIDDEYAAMRIDKEDVEPLVALLNLLDDVTDEEFRNLILNAKVLDTSAELR